jgi:hypothetical protein
VDKRVVPTPRGVRGRRALERCAGPVDALPHGEPLETLVNAHGHTLKLDRRAHTRRGRHRSRRRGDLDWSAHRRVHLGVAQPEHDAVGSVGAAVWEREGEREREREQVTGEPLLSSHLL